MLALATVTVCAALVVPATCEAKVRLGGVIVGGGAVAVPVRVTDCGEPVALSEMVSDPMTAPVVVGANFTLIRQLSPTARLLPQALEAV